MLASQAVRMRLLLILRLFSAVFLTLLGASLLFANVFDMQRVLGAVLSSIGLTALILVWLGARER
mgnify:CR=1 FL=1|jgi:hypothetical protein